eukprot:TRINITY_DN2131_c0_g1_i1.p1 TRINITY_DN2131_c0_g1~~TRINITY_DN2131_c0_g1_i1.p1  ORF type:complete len:161 (+),score=32.50 TRINITY_DN2131_c0_g1_i1:13-495(+)
MRTTTTTILLVSIYVAMTYAHLCLIYPPQRGGFNAASLNTPASKDCFLITEPCGGKTEGRQEWIVPPGGRDMVVTFQKNENHWTSEYPGTFNISVSIEGGEFMPIYSFEDTNTPALSLYTYSIPESYWNPWVLRFAVMQVAYYAPSINVTFYQCADLSLI